MKKILLSLMTLVLVLGLVGAGAFAYFSNTKTSGETVFRAGTVKITLGGDIGGGFIVSNMAPGDEVTKRLTVKNTGTLPIWFSSYISEWSHGTTGFIDQFDLVVTVTEGSGYYDNAWNMGNMLVLPAPLPFRDATVRGSMIGGVYPPLPPGATAIYDITFTLDVDTGNTYQNAWLKGKMSVDAVQSDHIGWAEAVSFFTN